MFYRSLAFSLAVQKSLSKVLLPLHRVEEFHNLEILALLQNLEIN